MFFIFNKIFGQNKTEHFRECFLQERQRNNDLRNQLRMADQQIEADAKIIEHTRLANKELARRNKALRENTPEKTTCYFQTYRGSEYYYFDFVGGNHKTILSSKPYKTKRSMMYGLRVAQRNAGIAEVQDDTKI